MPWSSSQGGISFGKWVVAPVSDCPSPAGNPQNQRLHCQRTTEAEIGRPRESGLNSFREHLISSKNDKERCPYTRCYRGWPVPGEPRAVGGGGGCRVSLGRKSWSCSTVMIATFILCILWAKPCTMILHTVPHLIIMPTQCLRCGYYSHFIDEKTEAGRI